jgi:hypothetical protein
MERLRRIHASGGDRARRAAITAIILWIVLLGALAVLIGPDQARST